MIWTPCLHLPRLVLSPGSGVEAATWPRKVPRVTGCGPASTGPHPSLGPCRCGHRHWGPLLPPLPAEPSTAKLVQASVIPTSSATAQKEFHIIVYRIFKPQVRQERLWSVEGTNSTNAIALATAASMRPPGIRQEIRVNEYPLGATSDDYYYYWIIYFLH